MKHILYLIAGLLFLSSHTLFAAEKSKSTAKTSDASPASMHCAAFSPYVGNLNPDFGDHPSKALINQLLDTLIKDTPFRCIMTYGVLNGLDYTFEAAKARHMKVIAIIWLDKDTEVNSASISKGIEVAKAYPDTIIKLSCGSEVRTRHGPAFDGEILRCIDALHEANVRQPITTIDTWWQWCNQSSPCTQTVFADKVDWIGSNIFPWWENKYSGLNPCIPAEKAAGFHIAKLAELRSTYPGKELIVTEFGWPGGPVGESESNINTGQHCGVASPENQALVITETFKLLKKKNWSGVVFQAFSEKWKTTHEGKFGSSWGICQGEPPYTCIKGLM